MIYSITGFSILILLNFSLTTAAGAAAEKCDLDNWNKVGSYSYKFVMQPERAKIAESVCSELDGSLISFDDKASFKSFNQFLDSCNITAEPKEFITDGVQKHDHTWVWLLTKKPVTDLVWCFQFPDKHFRAIQLAFRYMGGDGCYFNIYGSHARFTICMKK